MNFKKIEKKWQKIWEEEGIYKNYQRPKKFYVLDMFPYPSGEGLHVGHSRGYIATDVIARYKLMNGYSVLHPMGWDAFGLPAENYALKNKIHPKIAVDKNIKTFKKQLEKFGFTYDWEKEINTTDSNYYKWTQWIFLQLFKCGLAYESFEPINWCPSCKTGLANEDLEDGKCERCGSEIEKKPLRQWVLKMTAYAEKLLDGLRDLDWPESIKEQQRNWIGRSEGAEIEFRIKNLELRFKVFTTRLDTIFGCTYLVVAPEHEIIKDLELRIENLGEVKKYIDETKKKSEIQRMDLAKEKTGVELKGVKAINPFSAEGGSASGGNNEEIPIYVADYVLGHYGTGAVMAVPAHDERDWEFAKKYNLPIKCVIKPYVYPVNLNKHPQSDDEFWGQKNPELNKILSGEIFYNKDGNLIDSGQFTEMNLEKAREKMAKWLEENKFGSRKINYKLRDWVFSRQRYWGEPIPIIKCEKCGNVPVLEKNLPVKLPNVKSYEPTGTGESPLANIKKWVNIKCPKCGGLAKRETNTMPQWAGSSWYYLAYLIKKNKKYEWNKKEIKKWLPVNLYVGGVEHATRHLLYARFWHKFLYDIKVVSAKEPFKKLMNQGLILAEDGRKMSKRWGNVVNPDDIIKIYGADTLRLYEMFMGPFDQAIMWNTDGVRGMHRFLQRVYKLVQNFHAYRQAGKFEVESYNAKFKNDKLETLLHQTIKKITEDIENFRFNTAISSLMILFNEIEHANSAPSRSLSSRFGNANAPMRIEYFKTFLKLLSPFAPHLSEEFWSDLTSDSDNGRIKYKSIHREKWPKYNPKLIKEKQFELVIQINGKLRDKVSVPTGISQKEAEKIVLKRQKISEELVGEKIKKIIFVQNRLINIVI